MSEVYSNAFRVPDYEHEGDLASWKGELINVLDENNVAHDKYKITTEMENDYEYGQQAYVVIHTNDIKILDILHSEGY